MLDRQSIKQELVSLREQEKRERKSHRVYWKNRIAVCKGDLKQINKTLASTGQKPNLRSRFVYGLDSVTLRICRPFELKAEEIRYKRNDPKGYEADQVYKAACPLVGHLTSKVKNGKTLSTKETSLLVQLDIALTTITRGGFGRYHKECVDLSNTVRDLLTPIEASATEKEAIGAFTDLLGQAAEMAERLRCNEPVPEPTF